MFDTCMNALAVFGRMVVIGMISQYTEGEGGSWKSANYPGLCEKLLWKSQTVVSIRYPQKPSRMPKETLSMPFCNSKYLVSSCLNFLETFVEFSVFFHALIASKVTRKSNSLSPKYHHCSTLTTLWVEIWVCRLGSSSPTTPRCFRNTL